MKNNVLFLILLLLIVTQAGFSQVAINTTGAGPDPSAILDVNAPDKGLLIPRVSLNSIADNITPVNNPAIGLLVYNTGGNMTPGIYIWNGQNWASLATLEQVLDALPPEGGSGIYGEMFEYHAIGSYSVISIPDDGTYVQWTTAVQGDVNGMSFGSSTLLIENEGMYSVSFNSVVQFPSAGKIVDVALFVNGIRQDDLHGRNWIKEAGKADNISFCGMIRLELNDVVSIWFTSSKKGTIRLEIANLSLAKID
jgi:hypothetical protein